jgi:carotenoid cleavage dioxygenase-like enzyme
MTEGWVLALVYDANRDRSDPLVLNAADSPASRKRLSTCRNAWVPRGLRARRLMAQE